MLSRREAVRCCLDSRLSWKWSVAALRSGSQNRPASESWVWLSLLPLGLDAWAPAIAGDRCGVRRWTLWGFFWAAVALAGWVLTATSSKTSTPAVAGLLMLAGWIGGIVTSFAIRSEYEDRRSQLPPAASPWPRPTARSLVIAWIALAVSTSLDRVSYPTFPVNTQVLRSSKCARPSRCQTRRVHASVGGT
jgi:hypothetical protein